MLPIIITITGEPLTQEVLDAFEHSHAIPLDEDDNPIMSPEENVALQVQKYLQGTHQAYKATTDAEAARLAAIEAAELTSDGIVVSLTGVV